MSNHSKKKKRPENLQILDSAIAGDLDAFSILYQENVQKIFNYIYYRTGNVNDAEDLTARVFQRALKHITKFQKQGVPFSAWLYRIAHNLVANWHRDNSRRKEVPLDDRMDIQARQQQPEVILMNDQEVENLLKILHSLPSDKQFLIILKYVEGMTNQGIAEIMGKSEGAVKSLYHRTLTVLRNRMK